MPPYTRDEWKKLYDGTKDVEIKFHIDDIDAKEDEICGSKKLPFEESHDSVNHPNHYQGENGMEALDVIYAFTKGLDGGEAFCAGNAIKYILRWHKKNGIEDLEKARWYISQLIGFELTKKHTYDEEECNAYTE